MPDLRAFRDTVVSLACEGDLSDTRDRLVIVPTRAAAFHLVRSIENRLLGAEQAVLLPDMATPREMAGRLAERLPVTRPALTEAEREALLSGACRVARVEGCEPPFRLRPGLIAEMLRFYDTLRRNRRDVDAFERLVTAVLEPGAATDRGAERLLRQTRFLVAAFRSFERASVEAGSVDEHLILDELLATPSLHPWRHIVVTVGDHAFDPCGLCPADWDLLSRIPGLERVDIVVTDATLAGGFHEEIHQLLPGIAETRVDVSSVGTKPVLVLSSEGDVVHLARDREEEVANFARWTRNSVGTGSSVDRVALVFRQPLPYIYLAREVLRSSRVPCQMFDALPLAAEPYAAAVDLVCACISSNFARVQSVALLRSPHFRFARPSSQTSAGTPGARLTESAITELDRGLSEVGYLGDFDALDRIVDAWREPTGTARPSSGALAAAETLRHLVIQLLPMRSEASVAEHLGRLLAFLTTHQGAPSPEPSLSARQLRARGAVLGTLASLQEAYARFDPGPVPFDQAAATVRRWIEGQTFAPRTGESGVHLVDTESAKFGDFDLVQLAGLVDGEWPERPRRNIFYSPAILRDLGWPGESDRLHGIRSAFADLLLLPGERLIVSSFALEDDGIVAVSPLLDILEAAGLDAAEDAGVRARVFDHEALSAEPLRVDVLGPAARIAADVRLRTLAVSGMATPPRVRQPHTYSLSALERYQDCPFKFFAADVLRLDEGPEDESALSPRRRGVFIHRVFQRFFETWTARGTASITPARLDEARSVFAEVAEPMLDELPESEAFLERARLFGSAISVGMVDVVLDLEASRPLGVRERWLEHRFEGEFSLGAGEGSRVALRGVADRIDVLEGQRLRVIDYKSGSAPDTKRALQVPIYALCAKETLERRDGRPWTIDEAAYVSFSARRAYVPVVKSGATDGDQALCDARERLSRVIDGIANGHFPPRPYDPRICGYCAYPSVCRKDYVADE